MASLPKKVLQRFSSDIIHKTRIDVYLFMTFTIDKYVTGKGLDGLFLMLAEEEKKIRQDPAARVTDLLKKVFGNR
jgi:hypothetical protein